MSRKQNLHDQNSLWHNLENKDIGLSIKTCEPLLNKVTLNKLLTNIYDLYKSKSNFIDLVKLKKNILEESQFFNKQFIHLKD